MVASLALASPPLVGLASPVLLPPLALASVALLVVRKPPKEAARPNCAAADWISAPLGCGAGALF